MQCDEFSIQACETWHILSLRCPSSIHQRQNTTIPAKTTKCRHRLPQYIQSAIRRAQECGCDAVCSEQSMSRLIPTQKR
eukprot:11269_5